MIAVIEHLLMEEGLRFFPLWLKETEMILSGFKGFISLEEIGLPDNSEKTFILLRFQTFTLFEIWTSSTSHKLQLEKLKYFMKRGANAQIFKSKKF